MALRSIPLGSLPASRDSSHPRLGQAHCQLTSEESLLGITVPQQQKGMSVLRFLAEEPFTSSPSLSVTQPEGCVLHPFTSQGKAQGFC